MKPKDAEAVRSVGDWTRKKLEILEKYLRAYCQILSNQPKLNYYYIDAFSGSGKHRLKRDPKRVILGSPALAMSVERPFHHYYFIELDQRRVNELKKLTEGREDAEIIPGDCNEVLVKRLLPFIEAAWNRRAFCLLDPDGLNVKWAVIERCGRSGKVDMLLNFSVMGMNLNAALRDYSKIKPEYCRNMDDQWGSDGWRRVAYSQKASDLFPEEETQFVKSSNESIMQAYRLRLKEVAGFKSVSEPVPFFEPRSSSPIYYLFFASQYPVATKIFGDIIRKINRDGPDFWRLDHRTAKEDAS